MWLRVTFILSAFLICGSGSVIAQDFTIEPDSTQGVGYVDSLSQFNSVMTNLWDEENRIHWRKVVDAPDDWDVEICQRSLTCWPPFVFEETMIFPAEAEDVLEVKFYPRSEGIGSVTIIFTPEEDSTLRQEHTFSLRAQPLAVPRQNREGTPGLDIRISSQNSGYANHRFTLPKMTHVSLELFDIQGRLIANLWSGVADSGSHSFKVPDALRAGAYIVRMQADGFSTVSRRIVVAP